MKTTGNCQKEVTSDYKLYVNEAFPWRSNRLHERLYRTFFDKSARLFHQISGNK